MEVIDDVKDFWIKGYGYSINSDMSHDLLEDLLDCLTSSDSPRKACLRFGHAETVIPIIVALGMFKDIQDLSLASRPRLPQFHDRMWRSGRVCPFATNIQVALTKQNRVLVFHNEVEQVLPWCGTPCELDAFRQGISAIINRVGGHKKECSVEEEEKVEL